MQGFKVSLLSLLIFGFADGVQAERPVAATYVKTMVISAADENMSRQFFGRIAARETVDLSFERPGYLKWLNAQEGVRVEKGELLAHLDLGPFERALTRAELVFEQADRDFRRAKALAQSTIGSEVRAKDAETTRDVAKVTLDDTIEALEDARMTAPFSGLIAARIASPFSNVTAGQPIVRVHDLSEIRVEFDLPERVLKQIGDPSKVRFTTSLPSISDPVELSFREFRAEASDIGQSYTISLLVPPSDTNLLIPGATVTIRAELLATPKGAQVPTSAIFVDADRYTKVMEVVPQPDGKLVVSPRYVKVISETGSHLSIDGLSEGAEIVEVGGHLLTDGQPIERFTGLLFEEE